MYMIRITFRSEYNQAMRQHQDLAQQPPDRLLT